jgi:hypothetical protein
MDIYKRKSYWNIALAFFGLLILIITMVYSNFLAQKLKEREEENVKVYVQAVKEQLEFQNQLEHQIKVQSGLEYQLNQLETEKESIKDSIKALVLSSSILNQDVGVVSEIIQGNRMPVIWEDEIGRLDGYNLGAELDQNEEYLKTQKNKFIKSGKNPLIGSGSISKVYYFNQLFPIHPIATCRFIYLVGLFLLSRVQTQRAKSSMGRNGQRNSSPIRYTNISDHRMDRTSQTY